MYGKLPKILGEFKVGGHEFFSYQYLPIKMKHTEFRFEMRLEIFSELIQAATDSYVQERGVEELNNSYVYLTAKRMYQKSGCGFNRAGWHADGFGSPEEINTIWSDVQPTVYNTSKFDLSDNDSLSMQQMNEQALSTNDLTYPDGTLAQLDPYVIHKVGPYIEGVRTFFKLTFSKEKFNLEGNSHNYMFVYDWEMKPRNLNRNIPCGK